MSLSFSYSYDSQDENGDGSGNDDDTDNGTSTSNNSTDSSSGTSSPGDSNSTSPSDPTLAPTASPTEPDPSCFGLNRTDVDAMVYVQSTKESISYHVLENALEAAMREVLPFCEDITSRLRRLANIDSADGAYYIGNVDLEEADGNRK